MTGKILKKISEYFITLIIIITLNFFIPRIMPGDPFTFLSSDEGQISITYTQEQIERYKAYYGLDKPLTVQYANYVSNLFKGNMGYSIYYNGNVINIIWKRLPWTVSIVTAAILISCFIGIILGSLSAWYRNTVLDSGLYAFMVTISEIPAFLIGILFLFIFAAKLGLFPLAGGMKPFAEYGSLAEKIKDILNHAFLPVLTLSVIKIGEFYLLSRNSTILILKKDYMRTAKAKGLSKKRIIFRHAFKNAMPPIVTRIFLSLGVMFGAAIIVENVFNYPGVGRLMQEAVMVRDYVLVQGIFLFVTVSVLAMNLIADVIYKKIDPRVSL